MNRQEEREQAAIRYSNVYENMQSYYEGAKWADKTMIDKACKWIRYNRWKYEDSKEGNEIIEKDFRKAMEE